MAPGKTPSENGAGSLSVSEPEYLVVGFLRRPHGLRGELIMDVHTDFPERLKPGLTLFVGDDYEPKVIASRRPHGAAMLVRFRGIKTPEAAGIYRNTWVYVPAANRPALPEGEYYHHQLVGLTVVDENGNPLGVLADILETGANDVYVVKKPDGGELLLPAIPSVILDVDLADRQMKVHLLDGLV